MNKKPSNFKVPPDLYDAMVNWDKRLNHEKKFFIESFKKFKTQRLLDIGCGVGRHAEFFAAQVKEIVAMDPDREMIDYAVKEVIKSGNVKTICGGFKELAGMKTEPFDMITCLGNVLPVLGNRKAVKNALKTVKGKLKKHGISIFQFINFEAEILEKNIYYCPKTLLRDSKLYLFQRHFQYGKLKTKADFITSVINSISEVESCDINTTVMCTLKVRIFEKMALNCGFKKVEIFGDDTVSKFKKNNDSSLFAVLYS